MGYYDPESVSNRNDTEMSQSDAEPPLQKYKRMSFNERALVNSLGPGIRVNFDLGGFRAHFEPELHWV